MWALLPFKVSSSVYDDPIFRFPPAAAAIQSFSRYAETDDTKYTQKHQTVKVNYTKSTCLNDSFSLSRESIASCFGSISPSVSK